MNRIINYLSILAGRKFANSYNNNSEPRIVDGWKNVYIGLRQILPVKPCGKHEGNHDGSEYKPWRATQAF